MDARIMVIEDEAPIRERIVRMLGFEGFAATGYADGRGALEEARRQPPDLVICDVLMPGVDGFGICRVLQEDERTRTVPVIVLSALNTPGDRERAQAMGVRAYITKPFRNQLLVATVRRCLGAED